jgi:hypothetical protein
MRGLSSKNEILITSFLAPGEEIKYAEGMGLFAKTLIVLTDHRILRISSKKREADIDRPYLEANERYICHERSPTLFLKALRPKNSFVPGSFLILTNQRLLLLSKELSQDDSLPLADIMWVDLARLHGLGSHICGIMIAVREENHPRLIEHGISEDKAPWELFPRKICDAAGIKFSIPEICASDGPGTVLSFYVKSDLQWPAKCARCEAEARILKYTRRSRDREDKGVPGILLLSSVQFDIPYCQSCHRKKAVTIEKFDGVRAYVWFDNTTYAREFVQLNSR